MFVLKYVAKRFFVRFDAVRLKSSAFDYTANFVFAPRILYSSFFCLMPKVKCPYCGKQTEYTGNEFRPFCSERCKLLDFGAWADEEYALPTQTESLSEEEMREIERALEKKAE